MQLQGGSKPEDAVSFTSVSSEFYPELGAYYTEEAVKWLDEHLEEVFASELTEAEQEAYQRRLLAGPWESPWAFPDLTVDDLEPVGAQMLGNWLKARTGDPDARVIIDAPALKGERVCAIEIRWRGPELTRVRMRVSVVSAFSHFLVAADGEPYPLPQDDASPHAETPYPPRSPRTFSGVTVDDVDAVEAQQLGKWLAHGADSGIHRLGGPHLDKQTAESLNTVVKGLSVSWHACRVAALPEGVRNLNWLITGLTRRLERSCG